MLHVWIQLLLPIIDGTASHMIRQMVYSQCRRPRERHLLLRVQLRAGRNQALRSRRVESAHGECPVPRCA
jgi:hypothetical protein